MDLTDENLESASGGFSAGGGGCMPGQDGGNQSDGDSKDKGQVLNGRPDSGSTGVGDCGITGGSTGVSDCGITQ